MAEKPEWRARLAQVLAEEARRPAQWWYLSFCDGSRPAGSQFLGGCLVRAEGIMHATKRARFLGCYPGGEVLAVEAGTEEPSLPTNRLLSREELGPGVTLGELMGPA